MAKQMRITTFCTQLQKELKKHPNKNLSKLSHGDLLDLLDVIVALIASTLRSGKSVVFDRFFSFYRKPIKRSGFNEDKSGYKLNYSLRVRFRPTALFRKMSESDLTLGEYEELTKKTDGAE